MLQPLADAIGISLAATENIVYTIVALIAVVIGRTVVLRILNRNIDDHDAQYRAPDSDGPYQPPTGEATNAP